MDKKQGTADTDYNRFNSKVFLGEERQRNFKESSIKSNIVPKINLQALNQIK